mgnify:FL=1
MVANIDYSAYSPLLNLNLGQYATNVPFTNVGMVPFAENSSGSLYTYPRDPKIRDLLNYSNTYVRPEELGDFEDDPNSPDYYREGNTNIFEKPEGNIYNTELNPFNPSSQFFPYQQDASGIMGIEALQESNIPIYDISKIDASFNVPPGFKDVNVSPGRYGVQGTTSQYNPVTEEYDIPLSFTLGLNQPMLMKDKGSMDSTLGHEAKHFFENKYGFNIDNLTDQQKHDVIYMMQGMFYNNPVDPNRIPFALNQAEANAFMKMQNMGLAYLKNKLFPTPIRTKKIIEAEKAGENMDKYLGENVMTHSHGENVTGTHSHGDSGFHSHSNQGGGGQSGGVGGNDQGGGVGGGGVGGGADASSSDFGGGNVVIGSSFTPPSTNVSEETERIESILENRKKGSSQGFNYGGLVSISNLTKRL